MQIPSQLPGVKDLDHARTWALKFVRWYNNEHHHSGRGEAILKRRKEVYEAAKARHPERWSGDTRNWDLDHVVWLNPENVKTETSDERQVS